MSGRPTPGKPPVTFSVPAAPDKVSSRLNIRVADIQACCELWRSRGAECFGGADQAKNGEDSLAAFAILTVTLSRSASRPKMNNQQEKERSSGARDQEIRAALDRHWAASDANDFETEHRIYREDAVLEYPQSGERTRGRSNIQKPTRQSTEQEAVYGPPDHWQR